VRVADRARQEGIPNDGGGVRRQGHYG